MTSEYAEALEYFEHRYKKDRERYEKALLRGDQNTAAQIKAKMQKMEIACGAIETMLSSEFAKVVRCMDCKYRTKNTPYTRAGYCGRREAGSFFKTEPDSFCSYGERREEG